MNSQGFESSSLQPSHELASGLDHDTLTAQLTVELKTIFLPFLT